VASFDRQVRIDRNGIRLHNAELNITDWRNRQILISNRDGMKALDAAGKCIHDIPDAPILRDMDVKGHILGFNNPPTYFGAQMLDYTDVNTSRTATGAIVNVDLRPHLPAGLTNAKGVLVEVSAQVRLSTGKTQVNTEVYLKAWYSTVFNVDPSGTNNMMASMGVQSLDAGSAWRLRTLGHKIIPIVYDGNIPYVTWVSQLDFKTMTAINANYYTVVYLYLLGLTV